MTKVLAAVLTVFSFLQSLIFFFIKIIPIFHSRDVYLSYEYVSWPTSYIPAYLPSLIKFEYFGFCLFSLYMEMCKITCCKIQESVEISEMIGEISKA